MSTLMGYNGLQVIYPDPTGPGGLAINNNFRALSTKITNTDPTTGDNATYYYSAGSRWYNSSTGVEWICTYATTMTATWVKVTGLYLPLLGGTMTGEITMPADVSIFLGGGSAQYLASDGSNVYLSAGGGTLNLQGNEIAMPNGPQFINFRMFNSSTPPSSPNYSGQIYYNTSTNLSYVYNGTTWIQTSGCLPLSGGTLTGEFIINVNGAASTPGEYINGTWYTGGTATTTKPQLLVEPSGTTSTGWSTSGTGIGVNAASGFDGNMLDLQVNGTSLVSVNDQGVIAMNPSTRGCITIYSSSTIPQINLGDIASKCVAFYWASDVGYITTSSYSYPLSLGASQINLVGGGIQSLAATSTGSIVIGPGSALAISATDGFLYIPACAGAPTGTPTANAGTVPIVFDTTNSKIWIFNGSWKGVAVS